MPRHPGRRSATARRSGAEIPAAANELPDPVDTDAHADILAELGVEPGTSRTAARAG